MTEKEKTLKNNITKNISGAIFDLDGTLLDSMYIWDNIGIEYLENRGIVPNDDAKDDLKPMTLTDAAEYFKSVYKITDTVDEIIADVLKMTEHYYTDIFTLKPGVKEFLNLLSGKNIKMCVATSTDKVLARAALERNGVFDMFSGLLTCDEIGHGKDEPYIYNKALEIINTPKENTLVFEDAYYAIKTANGAGFKTVGIYDAFSDGEKELIKENTYLYINDWRELM